MKKKATEGQYDLQWKSPTDWQDNLQVADFSQIRTAAVEKLFVKSQYAFLTVGGFPAAEADAFLKPSAFQCRGKRSQIAGENQKRLT